MKQKDKITDYRKSARPVALSVGTLSRVFFGHDHRISSPGLCPGEQPRWSQACQALPGLQT